jgi:hypothetical protein
MCKLNDDPLCRCSRDIVIGLIQRCSASLEMSNKIALVSLDFAGAARMCGRDKGVGDDGCAIS